MMPVVWDILIWIFLAAGVGFGALGFFGLLIFPDIRSRMFTAIRAILISATATAVAVILFGINGFLVSGESQYVTLIIHTLFFYGVVVVANVSTARIILDRTRSESYCRPDPATTSDADDGPQKSD
jgi:multicomponent Na+:H+ antiporter subunit G